MSIASRETSAPGFHSHTVPSHGELNTAVVMCRVSHHEIIPLLVSETQVRSLSDEEIV